MKKFKLEEITNNEEKKSELFSTLYYSSYAANRDYGMTHEGAERIGLARPGFKEKYDKERAEYDQKQGEGRFNN